MLSASKAHKINNKRDISEHYKSKLGFMSWKTEPVN